MPVAPRDVPSCSNGLTSAHLHEDMSERLQLSGVPPLPTTNYLPIVEELASCLTAVHFVVVSGAARSKALDKCWSLLDISTMYACAEQGRLV
jgi:hypothetical protein